jgi:hypothetical protein
VRAAQEGRTNLSQLAKGGSEALSCCDKCSFLRVDAWDFRNVAHVPTAALFKDGGESKVSHRNSVRFDWERDKERHVQGIGIGRGIGMGWGMGSGSGIGRGGN